MPSWLRYLFIAALAVAGISLFGLAATSSDSKLFEKWFPVLSIVNRAIAVLLFAVVVAMIVRLWQRIRAGEFGAHMTSKLAGVMALIVLIPCITIYIVSNVFISRSIDSWFDFFVVGQQGLRNTQIFRRLLLGDAALLAQQFDDTIEFHDL